MKVVAFNGSARRAGNTSLLIREVFTVLESEGIETELVELAGTSLPGCIACYKCFEHQDQHCAVDDDRLNQYLDLMIAADGIILASPTYFADVSANLKALMERAGMVAMANNALFRRKVGAAVVTVRRGGAIHVFDSINHFFFIGQMIVPGSSYWNLGIGREIGEVTADAEGMKTMTTLGQNMSWLLKKIGS